MPSIGTVRHRLQRPEKPRALVTLWSGLGLPLTRCVASVTRISAGGEAHLRGHLRILGAVWLVEQLLPSEDVAPLMEYPGGQAPPTGSVRPTADVPLDGDDLLGVATFVGVAGLPGVDVVARRG